jgi:hypothetical protein
MAAPAVVAVVLYFFAGGCFALSSSERLRFDPLPPPPPPPPPPLSLSLLSLRRVVDVHVFAADAAPDKTRSEVHDSEEDEEGKLGEGPRPGVVMACLRHILGAAGP